MRDTQRISKILKTIEEIWEKNSDLRLCQLIGNCFEPKDLYYIEDDDLVNALNMMYCIKK